jgi:hypothetical protein
MSKLKLTNFSRMVPENPEASPKNQHYSISGVDPFYYLNQSAIQEQKYAPLAASKTFVTQGSYAAAQLLGMVPNTVSNVPVITFRNDGSVYGESTSGIVTNYTTLGSPTGGAIAANQGCRICIFAGYVLWIYSASASLYYNTITSPSAIAWLTVAGLHLNGGAGNRYLKNFLDFCAISDCDGTTKTANHVVMKLSPSLTLSQGIDLGIGWNISGMENLNNRYLAVAGAYASDGLYGSALSSDINYLFLWNGISARYNTSIRIPGVFVDMKCVGDQLFVLVTERGVQQALYQLVGNSLRRLFPLAIDFAYTATPSTLFGYELFTYNNLVGINLSTKGQYMYNPVSKEKFILTANTFDSLQQVKSTGELWAVNSGGITGLSFYTGTTYSPISYRSQWLDFKDPKQIVVKYATPPASGDSIQVTLDGFDEDGTASAALALTPITNLTKYNAYKTPLDCQGFQGKLVRVTLTTVSASGWQPILREIELIN